MSLFDRTILITGAARRLGSAIALAAAEHGADIILHYNTSLGEAQQTAEKIAALGRKAWLLQANLAESGAGDQLMKAAFDLSALDGIINNASIFKSVDFSHTTRADWDEHIHINLTIPFILTQKFAELYSGKGVGRVINMLDWRALRPGVDHFPYTISKAGLAALTRSTARNLAPRICVNAVALGAILPPEGEPEDVNLIKSVPMQRWASLDELTRTIMFLLDGPEYITGEIIHLDGGRHLV